MLRRARHRRPDRRTSADSGLEHTGFFDVGLFLFALGAGIIGLSLIGPRPEIDRFELDIAEPVSEDAIIIWISQQDLVSVNDEILNRADVRSEVVKLHEENPDSELFLMAHPDTRLAKLLAVRDSLMEQPHNWHGFIADPFYQIDKFYITD